jgi:sigma54-dependent transcription regulator
VGFALPGLAQRREDIAPNVEYELQRFSSSKQTQIRFDKEPALPIWHLPAPHRRNGAAIFAS